MFMTTTTWIVTGDSSRARILQVTGRERLEEIEDFINPKGRMNDRELRTDAHPRFNGHGGVGKAGSSRTGGPGSDREEMSQADLEAENFSRDIGRYLDKARTDHRFDQLYLVAPPKFLGMMRKQLGKELEKLVREDFDRNLSWFNAREIESFLRGSATGSARAP
jgi:protein required for attachment to host cells